MHRELHKSEYGAMTVTAKLILSRINTDERKIGVYNIRRILIEQCHLLWVIIDTFSRGRVYTFRKLKENFITGTLAGTLKNGGDSDYLSRIFQVPVVNVFFYLYSNIYRVKVVKL